MKGETTLTMNHDTLLEAIQLWLEHNFKDPAPEATQVKAATERNQYGKQDSFEVTLKPKPMSVGSIIAAIQDGA